MLQDPEARQFPWLNIWSPDDPISGKLRYYDPNLPPPANASDGWKSVTNVIDPQGFVWGAAHSHYWENDLLPKRFLHAILKTHGWDSEDVTWTAPKTNEEQATQEAQKLEN